MGIYRKNLLPLAAVTTPNRFEAQILADRPIVSVRDGLMACRDLHALGPKYVLLTSCLETPEEITILASERVDDGLDQHVIVVPKVPGRYTGTGDLLSALLVGWMNRHPDHFLMAARLALGTVQAVLERTLSLGGENADLRLVESIQDVINPPAMPPSRRVAIDG